MTNKQKNVCRGSSHGGHEWIRNGKYDHCICCHAIRLAKKVVLPKVKKVLIIGS